MSSRCQVFKERLHIPVRDAHFHCLPAEPKRLEGLDYTLAILDEARPNDGALEESAEQAIPVVSTMVRAWVRGTGEGWTPNDELEAVIVTATARLITNPGQIPVDHATGPFTQSLRGSFTGWTLAELAVLNRYRKRAW